MTGPEGPPIVASDPSDPTPSGADRVHHREVDEAKLRNVETAISYVLRIGVVASVVTVVIGLVLVFQHHPAYSTFSGKVSYHTIANRHSIFPHTIGQLGTALSHGTGQGVIVLGLIILLATPVMRVAVGVLSFVYEKDPPMTIVTLFVLGVLIASFFLG